MDRLPISKQTLQRLPLYLNYLKAAQQKDAVNISATTIADDLRLNQVQVRKDLAKVSTGGRPKLGYVKSELIRDIEAFLGYNDSNNAVLVGAGRLGGALLSYTGFKVYGLNIVSAFDIDENIIGSEIGGKKVFPMEKLGDLCQRLKIHIAIITVPCHAAQQVCDLLTGCGILAIWNFAPVHLEVPKDILVKQENLASSLAVLSGHLAERLNI